MNNVYFACSHCKVLVDAGYRWAMQLLHSGAITRGVPFAPERVLAESEYWSPEGEDGAWLRNDVLPHARAFFAAHASHNLIFGDEEEIMGLEPEAFLDWLDTSKAGELSPRHFAETLGLTLWVDAVALVRGLPREPWWWSDEDLVDAARRRFLLLVQQRSGR